MAKASIEIKANFDPMFSAMVDEAKRCPKFAAIAKSLADQDNVCVSDFKNGMVFAYPSDALLEAYYDHMAAKI